MEKEIKEVESEKVETKKSNNGSRAVIAILVILLFAVCGVFSWYVLNNNGTSSNNNSSQAGETQKKEKKDWFSIFKKKDKKEENNKQEENNSNAKGGELSKKFKNLYAFHIDEDSIYALTTDGKDELLVNYREKLFNKSEGYVKSCISYEYINGVLYIYSSVGFQNSTYGRKVENIEVYSIDLTNENPELVKEYEIPTNGEYINRELVQDENAIYYISYDWKESAHRYNSRILKFIKKTKEVKEVYDFDDYVLQGMFTIKNNNLYFKNTNYQGKLYSISLSDGTVKVMPYETLYYDGIGDKFVERSSDYNAKEFKIKVLNAKDFSTIDEMTENEEILDCYTVGKNLVYLIKPDTLKVKGEKDYTIDFSQYTNNREYFQKGAYHAIYVWDNYTVKVTMDFKEGGMPEVFQVDLKTGKVEKSSLPEGRSSVDSDTFLYIK